MTNLLDIDLPNRACEGKVQHATRESARAHAANLRQNSRRNRGGAKRAGLQVPLRRAFSRREFEEAEMRRLDQLWSVQPGNRPGVAILCADNGATYEMDAHRARRIAKAINADIERNARKRTRKVKP